MRLFKRRNKEVAKLGLTTTPPAAWPIAVTPPPSLLSSQLTPSTAINPVCGVPGCTVCTTSANIANLHMTGVGYPIQSGIYPTSQGNTTNPYQAIQNQQQAWAWPNPAPLQPSRCVRCNEDKVLPESDDYLCIDCAKKYVL